MKGIVARFADYTELFRTVKLVLWGLQEDLHKLGKWVIMWQMTFTTGKCKMMHTGPENLNFEFMLIRSKFAETK